MKHKGLNVILLAILHSYLSVLNNRPLFQTVIYCFISF